MIIAKQEIGVAEPRRGDIFNCRFHPLTLDFALHSLEVLYRYTLSGLATKMQLLGVRILTLLINIFATVYNNLSCLPNIFPSFP